MCGGIESIVNLGFAGGRQARGTVSAGGPLIKAKAGGIRPETGGGTIAGFEVTRR
jgi:hypothetical protein